MEKKKGGKRENSGAKSKYDKPTVMVSFRCPENRVSEFKEKANLILKSYAVNFVDVQKQDESEPVKVKINKELSKVISDGDKIDKLLQKRAPITNPEIYKIEVDSKEKIGFDETTVSAKKISFDCGCVIEDGLLRKDLKRKPNCKLNRDQHLNKS